MSLTCLTCVCGERCPRRGRRAKGQPAGRAGQGGKHCGRRVTFVVCPCAVWWWWCRVVVVQGSFGRAGAGLAALSALALCTLGLLGFFNSKCVPFRSPVRRCLLLRRHLSAPPFCAPPPYLPCMGLDCESVRSRPSAPPLQVGGRGVDACVS